MKKVIIIFLITSASCASSADWKKRENMSAPFDGKRFYNLEKMPDKSFWTVMKWRFNAPKNSWPQWVKSQPIKVPEKLLNLSFILVNHATVLIHMDGMNILTDPIWSERCSPVSFAGPKRVRQPSIAFEDLPKIDVVVISHNHYDHFDLPTIEMLKEKHDPMFFVGLGNGELLKSAGVSKYAELDWWEAYPINGVKVNFVPAQHWSARGVIDRSEALWGGFVIEGTQDKVYFAGDTGYGKFFKEIGQRYPNISLSLLPIGAYKPRWFMRHQHINPEEAVMAHQDLGSKMGAAIHYGTFKLSDEDIDEPLKDLRAAKTKLKVDNFIETDFGVIYNP